MMNIDVISWEKDTGKLKSYSASTKGKVSAVRIELEITNHSRLGWLLDELERIQVSQKPTRPGAQKAAALESGQ